MNTQARINEEQFAKKLRQQLDSGAERISPEVAQKLYQARNAAVARHTGTIRAPHQGWESAIAVALLKFRLLLMTMALMAGIVGTYYWYIFEEAQRHGEIDSEILADELQPAVHIDQGFRTWLERASSDSAPQ